MPLDPNSTINEISFEKANLTEYGSEISVSHAWLPETQGIQSLALQSYATEQKYGE